MNELKSNKKFKAPNPAKDLAGLAALAGMLNAHAGVQVPKETFAAPVAIKETPALVQPTPKPLVSSPAAVAVSITKVFLTGRFKVGKDFVAAQAGFKIHAFADPLYYLAEYFFGKRPKDELRTFLQQVGQIGRNVISAEYPLTLERACFIETIRGCAALNNRLKVDWASYGRNNNIWLDALVARVKAEPPGTRIAVSGVRFQHEYARLTDEGFLSFHVMASPDTWTARLKQAGLTPTSPAARDVSEHLAASLDLSVTKTLSQNPRGGKLRCIWSDDKVPPPSARLLTVGEFCTMFLR